MGWLKDPPATVIAIALAGVVVAGNTAQMPATVPPPPVQAAPPPVAPQATRQPPPDLGISVDDLQAALLNSSRRYKIMPRSGPYDDTIFAAKSSGMPGIYFAWGKPEAVRKIHFSLVTAGKSFITTINVRTMVADANAVFDRIFPDWRQPDQWLLGTMAALFDDLKVDGVRERRLQRDGISVVVGVTFAKNLVYGKNMFSIDVSAPAPEAAGTADEAAADRTLRGQLVDANGQCDRERLQAMLADYCPVASAIDAAEQRSRDRVYRDFGDYPSRNVEPGTSMVLKRPASLQDAPGPTGGKFPEHVLSEGAPITITSRVIVPRRDEYMNTVTNEVYYGVVSDGFPPGYISSHSLNWYDTNERRDARIQEIETLIDGDLAPLRQAFWKKTGYPFWTVATPMVACGIDKACKP